MRHCLVRILGSSQLRSSACFCLCYLCELLFLCMVTAKGFSGQPEASSPGIFCAPQRSVLDIVLTLVVLMAAELALAFVAAMRAPVGFEDGHGFHIGMASPDAPNSTQYE
jgi:hypothetical protein